MYSLPITERPSMLQRLLPHRVDNTYRGYKLALWLFGLLMLMKGVIGVNSILNGRTQSLINDINESSVSVLNLIVQNRDKFKNMSVPAAAEE